MALMHATFSLTTWLAHSKKKTCDVCKYPYSFTKGAHRWNVFAGLFTLNFTVSIRFGHAFPFACITSRASLRPTDRTSFAICVASSYGWIDLARIPALGHYLDVEDVLHNGRLDVRLLLILTHVRIHVPCNSAWWISNRPRPFTTLLVSDGLNSTVQVNATSPGGLNSSESANTTFSAVSFISHPIVRAISADIVAGQIIATVIVIAFVAVFLLREWISQNARPGVFDDVDPAAPPADEGAQAIPIQQPVPDDLQAQMENLRLRAEDLHAQAEALRIRVRANRLLREAHVAAPQPQPQSAVEAGADTNCLSPRAAAMQEIELDEAQRQRQATQTKWSDLLETDHEASTSTGVKLQRRRHSWNGQEGGKGTDEDKEGASATPAHELSGLEENADVWHEYAGDDDTPVKQVGEDKGKGKAPMQTKKTPTLNRPPLFSTAFFPEDPVLTPSLRPDAPLASPSLATYHAPEEFSGGAGPSDTTNYFRQEQTNDDDVEGRQRDVAEADEDKQEQDVLNRAEYATYFKQAEPSSAENDNVKTDSDSQHEDETPTPNIQSESDDDGQMPELKDWTDDEFDEPEPEHDEREHAHALHELPAPPQHGVIVGDQGPDAAVFNDNDEAGRNGENMDMPGGDALNDDDMDAGMDDDMEGALEAIGLRGPIQTVLQNVGSSS